MSRLDALVQELRAFVAERDWAQFHDPKNLAMAISSEAGELLAEYRWLHSSEADAWSDAQNNRERVAAEAADVGIALLLFCDRIGLDLVDAIRAKIAVNRANYPAALSRGRRETGSRPIGSLGCGGANMAHVPKVRFAEYVWGVFGILANAPDGLQAKDVIARLEQQLDLTDFERAEYPSAPGVRRFNKLVRFATISSVKAGWMLKEKGMWTLTRDGVDVRQRYPSPKALYDEVRKRYKQWRSAKPRTSKIEDEEGVGDEASASVTLEEAEEDAWKEIEAYLSKMPPYEFPAVGGRLVGRDGVPRRLGGAAG